MSYGYVSSTKEIVTSCEFSGSSRLPVSYYFNTELAKRTRSVSPLNPKNYERSRVTVIAFNAFFAVKLQRRAPKFKPY